MMMKDEDENGEKRLGQWVFRSVNLLVNLSALALMLYGGLWMKNNVPSLTDFKELQVQINSIDRSVLQLSETHKRIEDFEQRLRNLEKVDSRRFPQPRP